MDPCEAVFQGVARLAVFAALDLGVELHPARFAVAVKLSSEFVNVTFVKIVIVVAAFRVIARKFSLTFQ